MATSGIWQSPHTVGAMSLMAMGGIANAYFAYQQGKAQSRYQKAVAASMRLQAEMIRNAMETNRQNNITVAGDAAHRRTLQAIEQKGQQRTAMAASGVSESGYNAEALLAETESAKIQDVEQINDNLRRENYALWQKANAEAGNLEMRATLAEGEADVAIYTGKANAALSIMNGATQAALIGYNYLEKTGQLNKQTESIFSFQTTSAKNDMELDLGLSDYFKNSYKSGNPLFNF